MVVYGATSNRTPYLTANTLDQALLDQCSGDLSNQIELVAEIQAPDGSWIYVSDRNKYVGGTFYEARVEFPVIERTIGDWLSPEVEFSELEITVSNADGKYNNFLPQGADYVPWINNQVIIKVGLRDVVSTFFSIFSGKVTHVAGFNRNTSSFTLKARDRFDELNESIPNKVFADEWSDAEDDKEGEFIPIVLGDWTTNLSDPAQVPATVTNGADPDTISGVGPVVMHVSDNTQDLIENNTVYLLRGSEWTLVPVANVSINSNKYIIMTQGWTLPDSTAYLYSSSDRFYCRCRTFPPLGLSTVYINPVTIAIHLLREYGGLDIDNEMDRPTWEYYALKGNPAQSEILEYKARAWIGSSQSIIGYVKSLLQQCRLEPVFKNNGKITVKSFHFEEWTTPYNNASEILIYDIEKDSFVPRMSEINNFNKTQIAYDTNPRTGETVYKTNLFQNAASIAVAGKDITKFVIMPNAILDPLSIDYVSLHGQELLKLASGFFEEIELNVTWRFLFLEPGDMVRLNVEIDSSKYTNVPCVVRTIAYDPDGMKLRLKLWSLQMINFPGYEPGYSGMVGGYNQTIT